MSKRISIVAALLLGMALACARPSAAQEAHYSPAQAAYVKGEIKKAQERYVDKTAALSGVPAAKIRAWVPTDGRDVPPKVNVLQALAQERGKPFSEDERAQLIGIEKERFEAIERAKQEALKK